MSYLSRMERMGVEFLTRVSKERVKRVKRATFVVSLSARFRTRARVSQLQSVNHQQSLASVLPSQTLLAPAERRLNFLDVPQLEQQKTKQAILPERRYGFSADTMRQLRNIEWAGTVLGF